MKKEGIEFLKAMQKLELKDGDVVVIKSPQRLSGGQAELIKRAIKGELDVLRVQVRIMILDSGLDIGVLRKK